MMESVSLTMFSCQPQSKDFLIIPLVIIMSRVYE